MELKYITIPFDLEKAKRIQEGKEKGRIINKKGQPCRLICFDRIGENGDIIALVLYTQKYNDGTHMQFEAPHPFDKYGKINGSNRKDDTCSDLDLILEVPSKD